MVNPFICGSGNFHHQSEEEEDNFPSSSPTTSTPRKSRKFFKPKGIDKNNKNPYARFGRDKFSSLLAELEDKRKKIYNQIGSEKVSFVRFTYSNSNNCNPIVVRVRNKEKMGGEHNSKGLETFSTESSGSQKEIHQPRIDVGDKKNKKKMKREKQRPFYYLAVVVVVILLFLAMFGRSFAILCVSLGWYLVPAINGGKESDRRRGQKREYGRWESEKKIFSNGLSSPNSNGNMAVKEISPRRKSW